MARFSFKQVAKAFKDAFSGFSTDKITKLSASLAYYTVFSLGPLLIVIIFLCSVFFGREAVEGSIYTHIQGFIGSDAAKQIQDIIKNASISAKGGFAAVIGVITLLIGATSMFGEMQDSMNGIWGLKARPKAGWLKLVKDRLLSFGLVATLGFLLLVSLSATALVEAIGNRLEKAFPDVAVVVFYIINLIITLTVTTALFATVFKLLPDAWIRWKDIWPGAIATSLLFLIGKFAISFYIGKSNVGSTYGAAGSLVILLLWVYYSSIILYFGAEFTKTYALVRGAKIRPTEYAEWNHEAVVPGAETKEKQTGALKKPAPSKIQHEEKEEKISYPTPAWKKRKQVKKESPGIGMVLLGLALYWMKNNERGEM
ncbi:MAG: YihY/virulence factor BrkB family protein [Flavisolibacter sp.]